MSNKEADGMTPAMRAEMEAYLKSLAPPPRPSGIDRNYFLPEGKVEPVRMAMFVRDRLQGRFCWRGEPRIWYHHNGAHWERDVHAAALDRAVSACFIELRDQGSLTAGDVARLEGLTTKRSIRAALNARTGLEAPDPAPHVVEFPDGCGFDLLTREVLPPDPARFSTEVALQPDFSAPPVRFFDWLNERIPDDCHEHLRAFMRLALWGEVRKQLMLYIYGPPGTGKSTLNKVMLAIAGGYGMAGSAQQVIKRGGFSAHRQWLMKYGVKRFVALDELAGGKWDSEQLQSLVGGDPISANRMRQDDVEFTPVATIFATSNEAPAVPPDKGMWRRIFALRMDKAIDEGDQSEAAVRWITEEAGGILAWVLDGAGEALLDEAPASVEKLKGELVEANTPINEIFETLLERDPAGFVLAQQICMALKLSPDVDPFMQRIGTKALLTMIRQQRPDLEIGSKRVTVAGQKGFPIHGWRIREPEAPPF